MRGTAAGRGEPATAPVGRKGTGGCVATTDNLSTKRFRDCCYQTSVGSPDMDGYPGQTTPAGRQLDEHTPDISANVARETVFL